MVTVSWTRCKLYDKGQYNVHMYVHILCGATHRDVYAYGVSNTEKLTSAIGVARATQCVGAVWLLQV